MHGKCNEFRIKCPEPTLTPHAHRIKAIYTHHNSHRGEFSSSDIKSFSFITNVYVNTFNVNSRPIKNDQKHNWEIPRIIQIPEGCPLERIALITKAPYHL